MTLSPTSLSPLVAFNQDQIAMDLLWCETLVGIDGHNRVVPVLAERVPSRANGDVSADGLRITYHLRRDRKFADGVAFTSADVAFTYRAIFEPANGAAAVDAYSRIAALTTPDPYTVVIRLRKPWSAAPNVLFAQADFAYGILPAHAFTGLTIAGSPWADHPFGTGPFRVTSWQRGDRIELEPSPFFAPKPKLQRLVIQAIPNQSTAFNALRTRDVDAVELTADNLGEASALPTARVVRTTENGLNALYLQTTLAPTDDVRVRRAIAFGIDRSKIDEALHHVYPLATSFFPSSVVTWHAAIPEPAAFDLGRAMRALDDDGWRQHGAFRTKDGKRLTFLVVFDSTRTQATRTAVIVQQQLAKLGIDVVLKGYQAAVLSSETGPVRTGKFSLSISQLLGGSDPEQSINMQCAQVRSGENYSRFCSPALDAHVAAQRSATSDVARYGAFDAIATIVHDDVPLIPISEMAFFEGVDRRVTSYQRNMLRFPVHAELWDAAAR